MTTSDQNVLMGSMTSTTPATVTRKAKHVSKNETVVHAGQARKVASSFQTWDGGPVVTLCWVDGTRTLFAADETVEVTR